MVLNEDALFVILALPLDGDYKFSYVGENSSDLLGYSVFELSANSALFFDNIHKEDRDEFLGELMNSVESMASVHSIIRMKVENIYRSVEVRFALRRSDGPGCEWDGVIIDLSEEKESVPDLSRQLDFEILISSISTDFSGLSADQIDTAIIDALEKIAVFSGSERSYIFLVREDGKSVDNTYFWSDKREEINLCSVVNFDLKNGFPWIYSQIKKQEVVYLPYEDAIPKNAHNERDFFSSHGIKSLLLVPLAAKGKLYGFLGLDSLSEYQYWATNEQVLLRLCGEVFVNALNRKVSEEEANNAYRLFEDVIRQSPVPTCISDPKGNITIFNHAFSDTLNIDRDEKKNQNFLKMKSHWKIFDVDGVPVSNEDSPIACALRGIETSGRELYVELADGSHLWILATGSPIYDYKNKLIAGFITFLDITRLKQIESDLQMRIGELNESEARFRSYIEFAPDGIFVTDEMANYIEVNEAACRITGFDREELLNMGNQSIAYAADWEKVSRDFSSMKDIGTITGEYRIVRKDKNVIYLSVEFVKLNENRYLGFAKDITESKKMVEQLRQMEKMDAIGQLAGGIAHDFNNQIAIMMGYSEMLVAQLEDPQQLKFAKNILSSSQKSDDLTSKLLAFAHKGLYETREVNIHGIIGEVVDILSHSVNKNITIELEFNAQSSFTLGDPTQLQNILINLALNARDAMPDGGSLKFKTENITLDEKYCNTFPYEVTAGAFVKVTASDSGTGIEQQDLGRIFEPFFTTKAPGKGTGMGLASVYGAVVNHHAIIDVESTPGEGTSLIIYFPQIEHVKTERPKKSKIFLSKGDLSVLLIDDDESIRTMGKDIIESLGYKFFTCSGGPESLAFYRENGKNIDLVVLDMIMPVMGGKEVFRNLIKINPNVAVVLLSGFSMSGDVQQLLDEGACAFIGKPFEISHFSKVISNILSS